MTEPDTVMVVTLQCRVQRIAEMASEGSYLQNGLPNRSYRRRAECMFPRLE